MRETSETSRQPSLWDTAKSICSQGSESGPPPCGLPECQTIKKSGPHPAHASLSARQASEAGLLTSGTYGPPRSTSSATVALESSWVSRLRALTDSLGSTLYSLTWKVRVTPSGRQIPALRASVRRTSDSGCIGWPTPDSSVAQDGETIETWEKRRAGLKAKHGNGNGCGMPLTMAAALSGWPTTRTSDTNGSGEHGEGGLDLRTAVMLSGWPTASVADSRNSRNATAGRKEGAKPFNAGMTLCDAVSLSGWATPTSTDHKGGYEGGRIRDGKLSTDRLDVTAQLVGPARRTASGEILTGSSAAMPSGGRLSPAHSLWLMLGPFGTAWVRCAERVTRSTSRKPRRSSEQTTT